MKHFQPLVTAHPLNSPRLEFIPPLYQNVPRNLFRACITAAQLGKTRQEVPSYQLPPPLASNGNRNITRKTEIANESSVTSADERGRVLINDK